MRDWGVAALSMEEEAEDTQATVGRKKASVDVVLWRLHVNLGRAELPTMLRHLTHANATSFAIERI